MALRPGTSTTAPAAPATAPQMFSYSQATWIAPDGGVWPLTRTDLGFWMTNGVVGLDAAPVTVTTDPNERGGVDIRYVSANARQITVPIYGWGLDHLTFLGNWRNIIKAITQTRRLGAGTLRIDRPDGTARQIKAVYSDGLTGTNGTQYRWDTAAATLLCPDPFWSDINELVIPRSYSAGGKAFHAPFLALSSGQTLGETTVTNPGDTEAWPVWTITGPATGVTATRHNPDGTDTSFVLTPLTELGSGDTVTIATDPPEILGPDGSSWVAAANLRTGGVLWDLPPGDTDVTFSVAGSAAGTSIQLAFYPRYETA